MGMDKEATEAWKTAREQGQTEPKDGTAWAEYIARKTLPQPLPERANNDVKAL